MQRRKFIRKTNYPIQIYLRSVKDFKQYNIDIEDYIDKYFIGHYNPLGNFFCADVLRRRMINLLEPMPLPYLKD